jgi:hypothetical protein
MWMIFRLLMAIAAARLRFFRSLASYRKIGATRVRRRLTPNLTRGAPELIVFA